MTVIRTPAATAASRQRSDHGLAALPIHPLDRVRPPSLPRRALGWLGLSATPVLPQPSPAVGAFLARLPTGGWSIGRDSALALAHLFEETAPTTILEFGSGVSTVLFAGLCANLRTGSGRPARVVSLEENPAYAERTRRLLAACGLGGWAEVLVAPVQTTALPGWQGPMYRPDPADLAAALAGRPVDFLFVDGPASWARRGRGDCRYGTLLLARRWAATHAMFAADDALRSGDLAILRRWQALPWIDVRGVIGVGHGLGLGDLEGLAGRGR